jgi:hypothetical protein
MAKSDKLLEQVLRGTSDANKLANVEVIIQEWIDTAKGLGRPIPEPRGRLVFA